MKENDIRPKHLQEEFLRLSKEDINEFFNVAGDRVHSSCPACDEPKKFKRQFVKNGFVYVECPKCGTLFADPRPSEAAIDRYYKGSKAAQYWAEHLFKETEEARRKAIFSPKAKMVVNLLKEYSGQGKIENIVDVGMGYGIFGEEIRKLGYFNEIFGIEPSPFLAGVCRGKGFDVIEKPVEEVTGVGGAFEAATSFEVIEHLFSPEKFLIAINKILAGDGYLILTTLNIYGFELLSLWEKSGSIFPPHHINFFNLASLEMLLERTGYKVLKGFTPGKLDVDIVKNNIDRVQQNRFTRYLVEKAPGKAREGFQLFLQENNLSSHMCIIAQKV